MKTCHFLCNNPKNGKRLIYIDGGSCPRQLTSSYALSWSFICPYICLFEADSEIQLNISTATASNLNCNATATITATSNHNDVKTTYDCFKIFTAAATVNATATPTLKTTTTKTATEFRVLLESLRKLTSALQKNLSRKNLSSK